MRRRWPFLPPGRAMMVVVFSRGLGLSLLLWASKGVTATEKTASHKPDARVFAGSISPSFADLPAADHLVGAKEPPGPRRFRRAADVTPERLRLRPAAGEPELRAQTPRQGVTGRGPTTGKPQEELRTTPSFDHARRSPKRPQQHPALPTQIWDFGTAADASGVVTEPVEEKSKQLSNASNHSTVMPSKVWYAVGADHGSGSGTVASAKSGSLSLCLENKLAPEFFLLGAQKAGTTSFATEFSRGLNVVHPTALREEKRLLGWGVFEKELTYFNHAGRYAKGREWWLSHYPTCPADGKTGSPNKASSNNYGGSTKKAVATDYTPGYLSAREAPIRIAETYGEERKGRLTFLILLREPLSRMRSSYYHGVASGFVSRAFGSFQNYAHLAVATYVSGQHRSFHDTECQSYPETSTTFESCSGLPLTLSLYAPQLENWLRVFPAKQFVVAPMHAYFERFLLDGEEDLAQAMAVRTGAVFAPGAIRAEKPRENTAAYPYPPLEQDLDPTSLATLRGMLDQATGPAKLAAFLAPAAQQGLTLFNYRGDLADQAAIAAWIQKKW